MADKSTDPVPQSPEVQPADVREELDQTQVSHEGRQEATRGGKPSTHMGATEDAVTPVVPPMRGPGNLVGPEAAGDSRDEPTDEQLIDPVDEITPG
ncbi:MAG TPA: hypothetical protein VFM49_17945 [Chloroflexia bacterium]|jgi:hypothetical protein|nr:hypothetical protein [Chloroflexia bacterium]